MTSSIPSFKAWWIYTFPAPTAPGKAKSKPLKGSIDLFAQASFVALNTFENNFCASGFVADSPRVKSFGFPAVAFLIDFCIAFAAILLLSLIAFVISGVAFTHEFLNNQSLKYSLFINPNMAAVYANIDIPAETSDIPEFLNVSNESSADVNAI
jgi:hypothetical protein